VDNGPGPKPRDPPPPPQKKEGRNYLPLQYPCKFSPNTLAMIGPEDLFLDRCFEMSSSKSSLTQAFYPKTLNENTGLEYCILVNSNKQAHQYGGWPCSGGWAASPDSGGWEASPGSLHPPPRSVLSPTAARPANRCPAGIESP
jgi:hypothetical protein